MKISFLFAGHPLYCSWVNAMQIETEKLSALNRIRVPGTEHFRVYWLSANFGEKGHYTVSKREHHHTFYELHMMLKGCVTYALQGESVSVSEDQLLLIPPRCSHTVTYISGDFVKFSVGFDFGPEDAAQLPANAGFLYDVFSEELKSAITFMFQQAEAANCYSAELIRNRCFEVVLDLLNGEIRLPKMDEAEHSDYRLEKAKRLIEDNIGRPLKCADVAQHCYLSEKQMNRIFQKQEGTTVARYIGQVRLEKACSLLTETSLSLRQISEALAFQSEYYFHSFFTRHVGMTPGDYRISTQKR